MCKRFSPLTFLLVGSALTRPVSGADMPDAGALQQARGLTHRLYSVVTGMSQPGEPTLGYTPYAKVKDLLCRELRAPMEALMTEISNTPPDIKPVGAEFDYFSGFATPPESFKITQARMWGDSPEIELELTGSAQDPHFPRWRHRVWVHWSMRDSKMVLTNVLWPGGSLATTLEAWAHKDRGPSK